jgi:signal-transduction protein with cAMP-binding, CBS, and nucleotidyltransferase domain
MQFAQYVLWFTSHFRYERVNFSRKLHPCRITIDIGENNLSENQLETLYGSPPGAMHIMGDLMIPDERILNALQNSRLVENLRDFEVNILTSLFSFQYFEAREPFVELDNSFKDALMILVDGDVEVSAMVGDESVLLHLKKPGDLARIISFIGGNIVNVTASIEIRKDSAILLLQRSKLETLLHSHPSIVYCVMRNLIQHVHAVARRKNAENAEMSNYIYRIHGRY